MHTFLEEYLGERMCRVPKTLGIPVRICYAVQEETTDR